MAVSWHDIAGAAGFPRFRAGHGAHVMAVSWHDIAGAAGFWRFPGALPGPASHARRTRGRKRALNRSQDAIPAAAVHGSVAPIARLFETGLLARRFEQVSRSNFL